MTNQKKKREVFDKKKSAVPAGTLAEEFSNEFFETTNRDQDHASERVASLPQYES